MARVLRIAGAHQIISAQWNLHQALVPELLDQFYQELEGGAPVASALQKAKAQYLNSSGTIESDPALWASLVSFSL